MRQTINMDRINELKEMDEPGSDEVQRQLVEMFISSVPDKISDLRKSQSADDLKKAAHSLKSISLNMGCEILADFCQKIEKGDGDAKELTNSCENEFQNIKKELLRLYP